MIPQRTSTLVSPMRSRSQNIHSEEAGVRLPRTGTGVLAVPTTPAPDITGLADSAESRESFAHGITHPQAAVAPRFHLRYLGIGEQGIGDVLIVHEDGVVPAGIAHAARVGERVNINQEAPRDPA